MEIDRTPKALLVAIGKMVLGCDMVLFGCALEQRKRRVKIALDTHTGLEQDAELVKRTRMVLFGSLAVPVDRLVIVLVNADAILVAKAEVALGPRVLLAG